MRMWNNLLWIVLFSAECPWQGDAWTELMTNVNRSNYNIYPPRLTGHSAVVWADTFIVIYGGQFEITHRVMDMLPIEEPMEPSPNTNCSFLNNCTGYGYCRGNASHPYCECIYGYTGHMCQLGMDYDLSSDVWIFNMDQETWRRRRYSGDHSRLNTDRFDVWPTKRYHHTAVIYDNTMYIFGGYGRDFTDYTDELWEYNLLEASSWSDNGLGRWFKVTQYVNNLRPGERWLHSATVVRRSVFDQVLNSMTYVTGMFVYGGMSMNQMLDECWWYAIVGPYTPASYAAGVQRKWNQIDANPEIGYEPGPGARLRAQIVYDPSRDSIYLFGGYSSLDNYTSNYVAEGSQFAKDTRGEVWVLNMTTSNWTSIQALGTNYAPARMGHRMLLLLDSLVVHGGYWANQEYGDIWRFNLTSKYWIQQELHYSVTATPTKRYAHGFVLRKSTDTLYVFGGQTSRSTPGKTRPEYRLNDLWKYDALWCPNDCAGRGQCIFGYCFCEDGYYGFDCQEELCPASTCWYEKNTLRQNCKFCSNRGLCRDGVCRCNDGYEGPECTKIFCEYDCYNRGNCTEKGQCYQFRWNWDLVEFEGGAAKVETDTNETVIYTGPPHTTTRVIIPVQRLVIELAGIKFAYKYQTLLPPAPNLGPIVSYYIHHKEGNSIVQSYFGETESLEQYYRDLKKDQWSKKLYFEKEQMNVYVSDMKTISIVLEIQNRQRSLYIKPEVEYELCFLTKSREDLRCKCEDGWWGRLCEKKWCECSGHGSCRAINGTCECDESPEGKWIGHNCSIFRLNDPPPEDPNYIPVILLVAVILFVILEINLGHQ